jgi:HTH-type transcriptional regulator/antitoxin HigA
MSRFGWVESTDDKVKRVDALKNFFGVGNLDLIQHTYQVAYRKHNQISSISDYSLLAWLRKVELEGLKIETEKFSKRRLREIVPNLRTLTLKPPALAFNKIQALFAKCGVSVVLVEYLSKTYVCGASIWKGDKAIVAASDRGKRADIFWFSFFHEIAHLLNTNTRKKESHICFDGQESEIDNFAGNLLIPEKLYQRFLSEYKDKSKADITYFADKIGVAPYILVGRLLHDGLIEHNKYRDLLPPFDIRTMRSA